MTFTVTLPSWNPGARSTGSGFSSSARWSRLLVFVCVDTVLVRRSHDSEARQSFKGFLGEDLNVSSLLCSLFILIVSMFRFSD